MTLQLTFRVELESDYHIGAGHGNGPLIDSALFREHDGSPAIRGTTLAGLLRDGFERLFNLPLLATRAALCPPGGIGCSGKSPCLRCRLFGSPAHPKEWHFSSARPLGAPGGKSDEHAWNAGQHAQVTHHVRINPRTRRAEESHLFAQEEGSAALSFRFTITCHRSDAAAWDEAAALVASARTVRHLGAGRHRGRGLCRISLAEVNGAAPNAQADLLQRFEQVYLRCNATATAIGPAEQAPIFSVVAPASTPESPAQPVRVQVILNAMEPVIIARRMEAGNQYETQPSIPGSALIGGLARLAQRRCEMHDRNSPSYARFLDVFRRGAVRFPFLYPAIRSTRAPDRLVPAIPAPQDLLTCKAFPGFKRRRMDDRHGVWSPGIDGSAVPEQCPVCRRLGADVPLEVMDGFQPVFQQTDSALPDTVDLRRRSEMHLRLDPSTGRAAEGDLYTYVALAAGGFFAGELVCRSEQDWADLLLLLGCDPNAGEAAVEVRVGKATTRGYGRALLHLARISNDKPHLWYAAALASRVQSADQPITLLLLTDTIMVDTWGRFHQTIDAAALSDLLGFRATIDWVSVSSRVVDGFYGHTGLPRWRDVALSAGSAVTLRIVDDADGAAVRSRLSALETEGVGLRRQEGFGQVAFNHPIYTGCAGIQEYVEIPEVLRSHVQREQAVAGLPDDRLIARLPFEIELQKLQDRAVVKPGSSNWHGFGKWLLAHAGLPWPEIERQAAAFGLPQSLDGELETRSKATALRSDDLKPVLDIIKNMASATNGFDHMTANQLRHYVERLAQFVIESSRKGE